MRCFKLGILALLVAASFPSRIQPTASSKGSSLLLKSAKLQAGALLFKIFRLFAT